MSPPFTDDDTQKKDFRFVLTGFGPFNGVADNPTSILVRELPGFLSKRVNAGVVDTDVDLTSCMEALIIETSAEAVRREIGELRKKLEPFQSAIVLHLGVNVDGKRFHLEQCAYNDADFRVPDEKGFQPSRAPILDTCPWGSTITTSFDVPELVDLLNKSFSSAAFEEVLPISNVSTDPGRFVCNYIYCTSMNTFDCAKTISTTPTTEDENTDVPAAVDAESSSNYETKLPPRVQTLFLHVPPFELIPKEEQLDFVARLMGALVEQKRKSTAKYASTGTMS